MVWSEYLPLPLVLPEGAGPTDSRIVLDGSNIIVYDHAIPIIDIGIFSPDNNAVRPVISVQSGPVFTDSKIFLDVNVQGTPAITFTVGTNGFANAGLVRARTWNGVNNRNLLESSISTSGGINNGIVTIREKAAGGDTEIVINKTLLPIDANTPVGADFATETWHTLTLANLWVADILTPQYRLMPDGTVLLQGLMKNGTTTAGTVIGTLPAGYRPLQQQRLITAEQSLGTAFRHIAVQTNGDLKVFNCTAAFICIDGIRFPVI